ncbi:ribosomal protein S18-alanine N-acetyltransferase [uncultured Parasphingorhabdus sp.]|uniref:ribosomal protein S18-alanine N-acetyltransferase n=1 Tax=uncultured Parasphingorhabdus sp. TaxID=2709694 RepID=UPI002AA634C9|nr:ribosomal protein S18-alanine N-acetyltransferase [uncultured Parasphingorhabdus sp.]
MATRESPSEDHGLFPIGIRLGNLDDLGDVMHVMEHAFPKTYGEGWNTHQCRSMLSLPNAKLLIAECKNIICGFLISRQAADEEELLMIAVAPECRSKGVGYHLLEHMLRLSVNNGVNAVFLEMREDNPAKILYSKFGFQKIGVRKAYYTGPDMQKFDAVTYKTTLSV